MSASSIGPFNFIRMGNPPQPKKPTYTIERQAGVDGEAVWLAGSHNQLQMVRTFVDCPNVAAADALRNTYFAAIGSVHPIKWANLNRSYKVRVMDVVPVDEGMIGTAGAIGGLNGTSNARLVADWILLPVDTTT
jgi:hypothetical protein